MNIPWIDVVDLFVLKQSMLLLSFLTIFVITIAKNFTDNIVDLLLVQDWSVSVLHLKSFASD